MVTLVSLAIVILFYVPIKEHVIRWFLFCSEFFNTKSKFKLSILMNQLKLLITDLFASLLECADWRCVVFFLFFFFFCKNMYLYFVILIYINANVVLIIFSSIIGNIPCVCVYIYIRIYNVCIYMLYYVSVRDRDRSHISPGYVLDWPSALQKITKTCLLRLYICPLSKLFLLSLHKVLTELE